MEFVLVALGSLCTISTEPTIFQTEIGYKRTPVAGTAMIFGDTEMALSVDAVDRFVDLPGTPVIGGTG